MKLRLLLVVALSAVGLTFGLQTPSSAVEGKVLILESTVSGGYSSPEAVAALNLGLTVSVVSDSAWAAMTPADFGTYRALILGDPTCGATSPASAQGNALTWGSVVTGNVIINGTDPTYHLGQGGEQLIRSSIAFAVADPTRTGLYASLSCYYHDTAPGTPVPLLDGLGFQGFTVTGVGCYNNSHVVASHPALNGVTDATLSNWGCSVHEAFDKWPAEFSVLAMARDIGSAFTGSDGSVGTPYILARGAGLRTFPLSVDPVFQDVPFGGAAYLTAHLDDAETREPVANELLHAKVTSGPNVGSFIFCEPVTCRTDASGNLRFHYFGNLGADSLSVWVDREPNGVADIGEPQVRAAVTWTPKTAGSTYVALGDSYSAGEGNEGYEAGTDTSGNTCHRSSLGYPKLLSKRGGLLSDLDFGACSGAVTADFFGANTHNSGEKAQILRVGSAAQVVTFTIGGNDVGFADVLTDCVFAKNAFAQSQVTGRRGCRDRVSNTHSVDERMNALRGLGSATGPDGRDVRSFADVIASIHARSPEARIFMSGYPSIFGSFGSKASDTCTVGTAVSGGFPIDLFVERGDAVWINLQVATINSAIKKAVNSAKDKGWPVTFVNPVPAFAGHAICDSKDAWVNGAVFSPSDLSAIQPASFHPNILGQRAYRDAFVSAKVGK